MFKIQEYEMDTLHSFVDFKTAYKSYHLIYHIRKSYSIDDGLKPLMNVLSCILFNLVLEKIVRISAVTIAGPNLSV